MSKFYVMYRLNSNVIVIGCDGIEQAQDVALATRGQAWIYDSARGNWHRTGYDLKMFDNPRPKGKRDYIDVVRIQPLYRVPEDYKLRAMLLGS